MAHPCCYKVRHFNRNVPGSLRPMPTQIHDRAFAAVLSCGFETLRDVCLRNTIERIAPLSRSQQADAYSPRRFGAVRAQLDHEAKAGRYHARSGARRHLRAPDQAQPRQRRMIAERYAECETMAALAPEFGVGEATIWRSLRGQEGTAG